MTENMNCPEDLQLQSFNIKHRHSPTLRLFPSSAILKHKIREMLTLSKRVQKLSLEK
jgi:hypothetical protein